MAQLADGRRKLIATAFDAETKARRELAQALHDNTIQHLLAGQQEIEAGKAGDLQAFTRATDSVRRAAEQLRTTSLDLYPAALRHAGLAAALRTLAERQAEKAGFAAEVSVDEHIGEVCGELVFALRDDGRGFEPDTRAAAVLRGHVTAHPEPGPAY